MGSEIKADTLKLMKISINNTKQLLSGLNSVFILFGALSHLPSRQDSAVNDQ